MKTITFYSYKGGVGRSLALSNIALRLSEFNKKVCVIDFDLDAPGLQFKFKHNIPKITKGIVDYIHEFSCNGKIPKNIKEYSLEIPPKNQISKPIQFIAAGDIDSNAYWRKLTSIKWSDLLYSDDSMGIDFFLDMKAKIEKEIAPDFLLIDSRTGITDMSGITLRLLADEVVVLSTSNDENIYGSKKIIKSLMDPSLALFGEILKINFILTRLPYKDTPEEREKEIRLVEKIKNEFKEYLKIEEFDISMIHSDPRLEEDERQMIGDDYEKKAVSISNDYLQLFDILTKDVLTKKERELFIDKKNAEKEYNKALNERDNMKKLQYLNNAIELDSSQYQYFARRGLTFLLIKDIDSAKQDFLEVLNLESNNYGAFYCLGYVYYEKKDKTKAHTFLDKAIEIDPEIDLAYLKKATIYKEGKNYDSALNILTKFIESNPNTQDILNSRADIYRNLKEYGKAKNDIYKAIEINADDPVCFGTLAEIYASENKPEEFYLNLNIALSKGINAENMNTAKDAYQKFRKEDRLKNLLAKYNIDMDELFKESTD